jgi:hypothetical protein
MRKVGHVPCMREMTNTYKVLVDNLKGRDQLKDLGADMRIILKWSIKKSGGSVWTGFNWLRIGTNYELL